MPAKKNSKTKNGNGATLFYRNQSKENGILENIALLSLLFGSNNLLLPKIAAWSATAKTGLLMVTFLFIMIVPILLFGAGKKRAVIRSNQT